MWLPLIGARCTSQHTLSAPAKRLIARESHTPYPRPARPIRVPQPTYDAFPASHGILLHTSTFCTYARNTGRGCANYTLDGWRLGHDGISGHAHKKEGRAQQAKVRVAGVRGRISQTAARRV